MRRTISFLLALWAAWQVVSCNKTGGIPPPPPPDPCLSVNMGLAGTVTNPSQPGAADGSIQVSASGSGYSFSLDGTHFQSSPVFSLLAAGQYTVTARNRDGCLASVSFTISNPVPTCNGVNIQVTAQAGHQTPCEAANGTVTVSATGGTAPYLYSLDGGPFQSQPLFTALTAGNYMLSVKDAYGCTGNASITVGQAGPGTLFSQVKSIILNRCSYCHGSVVAQGGVDYSQDCNIVANKDRIKARAVDANPSPMPTGGLIPAAERQKIIDWINAGGKFTD